MNGEEQAIILQKNLDKVEERIASSCKKVARKRTEVTLVGVTKTVDSSLAKLLMEKGIDHLGESRPQELWEKASHLPNAKWHFIGHMQRNKIDKTLPLVHLFHSVDSIRLLQALEDECKKQNRMLDFLLEVNISGEENKQGFDPALVPGLVNQLTSLRHLQCQGLMGMAAYSLEKEQCRPAFQLLRSTRDKLSGLLGKNLPELSMGMSNDFEIAIEEGATLIRLGSILWEGLEQK
ncbi:MAG: YggS family pyridoxal phosphate-dependent enzyme [Planctomycetes bacterium]|nr:YggS family pyridoxal phosphate-dependent enzyme [Planctomycetota bacterium]